MLSEMAKVLICWPSCRMTGCTSLSAWVMFMRFAMDRWLKHTGTVALGLDGAFGTTLSAILFP